MKKMRKNQKPVVDAIEQFLSLPDDEKERIFQDLESKSTEELLAESRPLNAEERARLARFKRGLGRPRKGEGAKAINVTVEAGLLRKADAFALKRGVSRAQLVAQGLQLVMRA